MGEPEPPLAVSGLVLRSLVSDDVLWPLMSQALDLAQDRVAQRGERDDGAHAVLVELLEIWPAYSIGHLWSAAVSLELEAGDVQ